MCIYIYIYTHTHTHTTSQLRHPLQTHTQSSTAARLPSDCHSQSTSPPHSFAQTPCYVARTGACTLSLTISPSLHVVNVFAVL